MRKKDQYTGPHKGIGGIAASIISFWRKNRTAKKSTVDVADKQNWLDLDDIHVSLNSTIKHLAEGVYRASLDGKKIYANQALVRLNGYDNYEEMAANVKDIAIEWYVDKNRRAKFVNYLERHGHISNFVSEIYRHKTRERIWISENARLVRDERTGKSLYYEGSVREVTDRIRSKRQANVFSKLASNLPGGLFQMEVRKDKRVYVPYVSAGFCQFIDIPVVSSIEDARQYFDRVHPDDRDIYNNSMIKSAREMIEWRAEFRLLDDKGNLRWATLLATPESFKDGIRWYGYMFDTTEQKRQEKEINQLAYYDSLTGLMNRQFLTDQLEKAMQHSRNLGIYGAVLFIDLDNFKTLNDNFGHNYGDTLLKQIAKRLLQVVPDNEYVARFGGDEFVVLLSNAGNTLEQAKIVASEMAQSICSIISSPVDLAGHQHESTCSVGVSFFSRQETTLADVLAAADTAMYDAKRKGRNTFEVFDDAMQSARSRRYALLQDLKKALDTGQFSLMLQPQVDRHGHIVGAEALARWSHPEYGMVSPAEFIPIIEKSGHILDFSFWSLAEGLAILERWRHDDLTAPLNLSLNLSPHCISQEVLWHRIEQMVDDSNGLGARLTLELTESAAASNMDITKRKMAKIKQYGVDFAIDDFGTGYSAFANLKHLTFDELKIDDAFVRNIADSDVDQHLVKAVIDTARALNMRVVAEFVETDIQEETLRALGCDLFQGYRYSPAVPEDKFRELASVMSGTVANSAQKKSCG